MDLTDIMPIEKWRELEEEIFERSGLASNVFDVDGIRITDYKVWVNRLCPVVKADDGGQSFICAVAHMNVANMSKQVRGPVVGECDAGLLKLVVPVMVNDRFLGAVGACGLLLDDSDVDTFMVGRTIKMEEEQIDDMSNDIKRLTEKEAEELGAYIEKRICKIISDFIAREN